VEFGKVNMLAFTVAAGGKAIYNANVLQQGSSTIARKKEQMFV